MAKQITYHIKKAYQTALQSDDFLKFFVFRIDDIITANTNRHFGTYQQVRRDILYLSQMSKCNGYPTRKYLELVKRYVAGTIQKYEDEQRPDPESQLNDLFAA